MAVVETRLPLTVRVIDVADFHGTRRQGTLEAPQDGLDAGDEFTRTEGFGNVIVGAEFKAENAVGFAALRGQENYRHRGQSGSLADRAADLQAVFAGNHNVEDEERGALPFGIGKDVRAGGIHAHSEAFVFEVMADQSGNVGIVFDDEKTWFHGIIVNGKQWAVVSCPWPEAGAGVNFIGL